jgi:VWFA-related protein
MFIHPRSGCLVLATLLCCAAGSAQQNTAPAQAPLAQTASRTGYLDVMVTPKSVPPVVLQQQDFTLLDNKTPRTITSFHAVSGREAPIEVIVVIDAVNTAFRNVAYEREQLDSYLRAEGGHLAYPVAIAFFTDKGLQVLGDFSIDGNALGALLDGENTPLRFISRGSGVYGAADRLQLSLQALDRLLAGEAPRPGRKIMVWLSPGWPLLSGPHVELDGKERQQIFGDIVRFSTELLQARVTLYSVYPSLGAGEPLSRAVYYKEFLKGVSKPSQVNLGNLGLQVLAVQSGGLALNSSNDLAAVLRQCVDDATPYYEVSFDLSGAEKPDQYHQLEIKLDKPGLTARTRQAYYAQPLPN